MLEKITDWIIGYAGTFPLHDRWFDRIVMLIMLVFVIGSLKYALKEFFKHEGGNHER